MFREPTTIILGAGASCSYGYPTGEKLIKDIIGFCKPRVQGVVREFESDEAEALHESLNFYQPLSIDSFLTHYRDSPELVNYAKKQIAKVILRDAQEDSFSKDATIDGDPSHWYRYLWNAIVSGHDVEELVAAENTLNFNIITFNYDSSLEFYLRKCIYSQYSMFDGTQGVFWEKILSKIHHVYGEILDFESEQGDNKNMLNYAHFQLDALAEEKYQRIQLISEREEADYQHLRDLIAHSTQIVFLGFGFDDINCGADVLNLTNEGIGSKTIKYTNHDDFEIINRRVLSFAGNSNAAGRLHKSRKKVYQALAEDFTIN